ncbi:MAG: hypothetical protein IJT50_14640 [Lentisphaeria bacterium]|nr:hypothetical protein [Lentisphaeria bacterium]
MAWQSQDIGKLPRQDAFPLRLEGVFYCNNSRFPFTGRAHVCKFFEISLRLRSESRRCEDLLDGRPMDIPFPNIVFKRPGMKVALAGDLPRDTLSFMYSPRSEEVLRGWNLIPKESFLPFRLTERLQELVEELRSRLMKCRGIRGVHDIIMHNYGPNQYFATAHAEVDLDTDIYAVHDLLEQAEAEIGKNMPVHLLLHCDPCHASGPRTREWQDKVENAAAEINPMFKVYDFRFRREGKTPRLEFELLVPSTCSADMKEIEAQLAAVMKRYPAAPPLDFKIVHSSGAGQH